MDVTVVGSGPNGLWRRRSSAPAPGFGAGSGGPAHPGGVPGPRRPGVRRVRHDICSAIHPLALASPFFTEFDLAARGSGWRYRRSPTPTRCRGGPRRSPTADLERTCAGWNMAIVAQPARPLVHNADDVVGFFLGDKRSLPTDLPATVRTGLRMLPRAPRPGVRCAARTPGRCSPVGGAHHFADAVASWRSTGAGLMLATLAHTAGWPVPVGGSQAIADALIDDLRAHGGVLHTESGVDAPPSGVVLYDTAPTALLDIYGDRLPNAYAKLLRRYTVRPGVAKVDFVLSDEIPWTDRRQATAATIHLGGTRPQMALAEREIAAGPARGMADGAGRDALHRRTRAASTPGPPAVLDLRARPGRLSTVDQAATITGQFERFAPVSVTSCWRRVVPAADVLTQRQLRRRRHHRGRGDRWCALPWPDPPAVNPWTTPIPKAYLCSSATPPGRRARDVRVFAARLKRKRDQDALPVPSPAAQPGPERSPRRFR